MLLRFEDMEDYTSVIDKEDGKEIGRIAYNSKRRSFVFHQMVDEIFTAELAELANVMELITANRKLQFNDFNK